jgi:2-alkyl-3-oxoalkanoate reductase
MSGLVPVEKKSLKIFVTGATGFVGLTLLNRLIKEGHEVTGLCRSEDGLNQIRQLGVRATLGGLENILDWADSLRGFDVVIHCAAPVEFHGPRSKFMDLILQATLLLAEAASRRGVKRFIHLSSESVLYDHKPLINVDETYAYPQTPNSYYGEAKKYAEQGLLELKVPMEIIILRPPFVWGVGCPAFKKIEKKIKRGQFVWVDGGRSAFDVIHVDNLVEAITCAIKKGKNKGLYFVSDGDTVSCRDFLEPIFRHLNLEAGKRSIPSRIAYPFATLAEKIWKTLKLKGEPPLARIEVDFIALPRKFNIAKATFELGYRPIKNRKVALEELTSASH